MGVLLSLKDNHLADFGARSEILRFSREDIYKEYGELSERDPHLI